MSHTIIEKNKLPAEFLAMIKAIYDSLILFVSDNGQSSITKSQSAGISQGCPLSACLFAIVINKMIMDAPATLRDSVGDISSEVSKT